MSDLTKMNSHFLVATVHLHKNFQNLKYQINARLESGQINKMEASFKFV